MDSRRLKIVHLIEPGSGGTMRHVLDLARAQADTSHDVTIIYSPVRLEPLYEAQLQSLVNVKLYSLPMRRAPQPSDLTDVFSLVKILHAEKPDILHAHSNKAGLLARLARIFVPMRVIYTPHAMMSMNPGMKQWKKMIYTAYEHMMLMLTDKMVVLAKFEHDHAQSLGLPAAKLAIAVNGIGHAPLADRAALRAAQNITDDQFVTGFVGRMVKQKNPELAIRVFAKAYAQNPNLVFYVIGDGELLPTCQTLAKELNVEKNIRWLGGVDARPHYAAMDLLLSTSRYEGLPYSFIEALQAGVPIVSTNVSGSDSCVLPGQTGAIAAADADALATEIVKICADPTLQDAMRFAARVQAQNFGIPQMLASVMAVYRDALNH